MSNSNAESYVYSCECGGEFDNIQSLSGHLQEKHNAVLVQDETGTTHEVEGNLDDADIATETEIKNDFKDDYRHAKIERSCKLSPATEQLLRDHFCERSYMQNDDEINFCETCEMMYLNTKAFVAHCIEKHTGRKQYYGGKKSSSLDHYTCYFCGNTFYSQRLLYQHQSQHPGVQLFQCPPCLQRFTEKNELRQHFQKHVGAHKFSSGPEANQARIINMYLKEQPSIGKRAKKRKKLKCSSCAESFTDADGLSLHVNIAHSTETRHIE